MSWLQNKTPGIFKFGSDFFNAMKNDKSGQSLRKWLSVGFFWLSAYLAVKFTTENNLIAVLGILTGMIISLCVTYTAGNNREQRINKDVSTTTTQNINKTDVSEISTESK